MKGLGRVNADFGRKEGDRILKEVAASIVKATSALNIAGSRVYRLGGDEFCTVLPGLSHADSLIEALRQTARCPVCVMP